MAVFELSDGAADRGVVDALVICDGFHFMAALLVGVDKCLIGANPLGARTVTLKSAGVLDPHCRATSAPPGASTAFVQASVRHAQLGYPSYNPHLS